MVVSDGAWNEGYILKGNNDHTLTPLVQYSWGLSLFSIIYSVMRSQISCFPRGQFSSFTKQDGVRIPKRSSVHFVRFDFSPQRFCSCMYWEQMSLCRANKTHRLFQSGIRVDASNKEKNSKLYDALFEVQSIIGSQFYFDNGTISQFKNSGYKGQCRLVTSRPHKFQGRIAKRAK